MTGWRKIDSITSFCQLKNHQCRSISAQSLTHALLDIIQLSYRLHHPSDPKYHYKALQSLPYPPTFQFFYISNPTFLDSVDSCSLKQRKHSPKVHLLQKSCKSLCSRREHCQHCELHVFLYHYKWDHHTKNSKIKKKNSKYWSTNKLFSPGEKSLPIHRTQKGNKLQAEQPTLLYLSQWELPLELLCPDSCWASRRIFSMSPLWMEEEDGTCSRPPFLALPLSLPFPFICSSTQEPVGQPNVTPRVHPTSPQLWTPLQVIKGSQRGAPAVLGADNIHWAEGAHKHRDSSDRVLSSAQTPLKTALLPDPGAGQENVPFLPSYSYFNQPHLCSLELQLTPWHITLFYLPSSHRIFIPLPPAIKLPLCSFIFSFPLLPKALDQSPIFL